MSYHHYQPPSQILALAAAGLALALVICTGSSIPVDAAGSSKSDNHETVRPDDSNDVTLADIRSSYGKRYPFAAEAAQKDKVSDGSSEDGSSADFRDPAYDSVQWRCMDDRDRGNPPAGDEIHYEQEHCSGEAQLATQRDQEAFRKGWIKCYGLPISDTQFQLIDRERRQRLLELFFDPERWMWKETTVSHLQSTSMSNSVAGAAESSFKAAFGAINETLINVANENSAVSVSAGSNGRRSAAQAVYIVQQMYKQLFVPMALLFLLPGAVLTQVKGLVTRGFLAADEDSASPFAGILRALIAVFLIPSTQLIVSYAIDTGNALTCAVTDPQKHWIQEETLVRWAREQTYNPPQGNVSNAILSAPQNASTGQGADSVDPAQKASSNGRSSTSSTGAPDRASALSRSGNETRAGSTTAGSIDIGKYVGASPDNPVVGGINSVLNWLLGGPASNPASEDGGASAGEGKSAGELERNVTNEDQLWLSGAMQTAFNSASYVMGYSLTALTAYQLVFMCYLFLLGPIAAAFYAWPSGVGSLFRKVFTNWVDAVLVLALWRFWWCVILAVMTQRVVYLHPNPGSPAEMMAYNCFLALLLYIPFQPFNFNPGPIVANVLDKVAGGGAGGSGAAAASTGTTSGAAVVPGAASSPSQAAHSTASNSQVIDAGRFDTGAMTSGGASRNGASEREGQEDSARPNERAQSESTPPSASRTEQPTGPAGAPPSMVSDTLSGPAGQNYVQLPPMTAANQGTAPQNPAAEALQRDFGISRLQAIASGSGPTVPLAPPEEGGSVLLNTRNPDHAGAGLRFWQQAASQATSSSLTSEGSSPAGGINLAATATPGSAAPPLAEASRYSPAPEANAVAPVSEIAAAAPAQESVPGARDSANPFPAQGIRTTVTEPPSTDRLPDAGSQLTAPPPQSRRWEQNPDTS